MERLLRHIIACIFLFIAPAAYGQTVIYQDDFEGTVSGWSVNDTDYDDDVTNFLGRFSGLQTTTSRSFAVPAGATQLDIEFDLYRFDSWDIHLTDGFELDIDGTVFFYTFAAPTGSGSSGNVSWSYTRTRGPEQFAFNPGIEPWWREQLFNFQITVSNPSASVALTLKGDLNQPESDESIGYDNFLVTAMAPVPPPIILAVDDMEGLPFSSAAQTSVLNVVDNDTFDGVSPAAFDLFLNTATSLSGELTFDTITGEVGIAAAAPAGVYSFDYDICETGTANCETATVTITIEPASPSLAITKVAGAPGPYKAGEVVTYTYTVANDGDTIIRDIAINDTHNGSDPAPTPINETLITDTGTIGDSTDAASDGSWDVLAPGDVITFIGTYTVTQTDVNTL